MIGKDQGQGRTSRWVVRGVWVLVGSIVGGSGLLPAIAQQTKTAPKGAVAKRTVDPNAPTIKEVRTLVSPNEPIALVNGEAITRQQLADACIARKGEEILETLIARKLIDQELAKRKMKITPAEVDAEIEHVAQTVGHVSKDQWLATLSKERKISPSMYAQDIIVPTIALRKLAEPGIKVTQEELEEALTSYYGEKLRCRIIMFNNLNTAKQTWEDLKRTPAAWDKLVAERSIDQASRSVGGLLTEPIARHADPRNVSDAAFRELVDLDPAIQTKDEAERAKYLPKDGDLTGVIQVTEGSWVILKREGLEAAKPRDSKDKLLAEQFRQAIFDLKLKEQIGLVYGELLRAAGVENRLTGETKLANEEHEPEHRVDGQVKRMSNPDAALPAVKSGLINDDNSAAPGSKPAAGRAKVGSQAPAGVDPADIKGIEKIRKDSDK